MDDPRLYSVEQVRTLERMAMARLRVSGYELMQRAARAAFDLLRVRWPQARRIAVYGGGGNNGGDGYALARLAREAGFDVHLRALAEPPAGGEAAQALADWRAGGGAVHGAAADWPQADVHVDALFGIGLTRPLDGVARDWVERLNAAAAPVLALDVPSGLDADTGSVRDLAVEASATITFLARKRGLSTGQAADHVGEVVFDPLGVPEEIYTSVKSDARLIDAAALHAWLPARARGAHKGDCGYVLAIGGERGMGGAIRLAGEAALRVGAGLVGVATRDSHVVALNAARPELMAHGIDGARQLQPLLGRADVVALGPGLGTRLWARALWQTAIAAGKPLVLDADGLNLLARTPRALPAQTVLTPHPGEAARLLGVGTQDIARDRFRAARELARRHRAVAVLKGAGSLIANPEGEVAVCPWGNPGMASGGMGDVLTGVIAGLLAQGLDPWTAARAGVALHAQAGDAAALHGEAGLLASDLFAPLRRLRNGLAI